MNSCWIFPGGSDSKESTCNADLGLIPGSGRSPRERSGNPLQYSCLQNSMDRGAWQATVHRVTKSRTWLSNYLFTFFYMDIDTGGRIWSSNYTKYEPKITSVGGERIGGQCEQITSRRFQGKFKWTWWRCSQGYFYRDPLLSTLPTSKQRLLEALK